MQWKLLNNATITLFLFFMLLVLLISVTLEFPPASPSNSAPTKNSGFYVLPTVSDPFIDLISAFEKWDSQVGCTQFRKKYSGNNASFYPCDFHCSGLKMNHVTILVKGWTWIPDSLDTLYLCDCGMSCLWTKSPVLADKPDALLFESTTPPWKRRVGDPLRVYMDLEPGRKHSGHEDVFVSYHPKDDVQASYAGALFHRNRNYHISSLKNNDTLVYWSSSRCLPQRDRLAKNLLRLLPHHSFGKCLNNVGGVDNRALDLYPECTYDGENAPNWWDHLHCAMSHYKFVLAIENTFAESYVTEKLFYALDSGSVPIYFGAPDVHDWVPPHSIIDASRFTSLEELASYVKALANDPLAYAEYHAWRRCGVLGNYSRARAMSLDTLPCRLCSEISRRGGRGANA